MKRSYKYIFLLFLLGMEAIAIPPWWVDRGVVDTNEASADYAPVILGQLKWFMTNAYDELEENIPGGAGSELWEYVRNFSNANNYCTVNIGQVKQAAKLVYDRLIEVSYTTNYPWSNVSTDDCDWAIANIGQLKQVFDFDLRGDEDEDGLKDWWEMKYFGDLDETGTGDNDGDGLNNLGEYENGANPLDTDTDDDGMPDGWEVSYHLNPRVNDAQVDSDKDGVNNFTEYLQGRDPRAGVVEDSEGIVGLVVYTVLE